MKSLKLVWLSDRFHIRLYGRSILNDTYFALNYGPVASGTKDLIEGTSFLNPTEKVYRDQFIENSDNYTYRSVSEVEYRVFSKTDLDAMEKIYSEFGQLSKFDLSEESHKYPEWKKFEGHLKSKNSSRFKMNYEDFFSNFQERENSIFNMEPNSLELSKDLFLENDHIYRLI